MTPTYRSGLSAGAGARSPSAQAGGGLEQDSKIGAFESDGDAPPKVDVDVAGGEVDGQHSLPVVGKAHRYSTRRGRAQIAKLEIDQVGTGHEVGEDGGHRG